VNITDTIEPKVDQLTADHLIGRTLTIRITDVRLSSSEQPCDIHYEGENGLPYRPGKSMRRVLVHVWGGDVKQYVGRSLTLYRDDDVQFGGLKVGGIRISHMSHISAPVTMALTAKKGSKKAYKVQPLVLDEAPTVEPMLVVTPDLTRTARVSPEKWLGKVGEALAKITLAEALTAWRAAMGPNIVAVLEVDEAKAQEADKLIAARVAELSAPPAGADTQASGDMFPG
jgi:hypothetical protein